MRKQLFKKMLATTLAVSLGLSFPIAQPANISADSSMAVEGYLVWSDEFNSKTLNTDNWAYDIGNGNDGWGNKERQYYTDSSANVYTTDISKDTASGSKDGRALAIKCIKESNGALTSGRIKTQNNFSFKYGRMEARIKVEKGSQPGVWPAFWMLGDTHSTLGWPKCGEIDILEHRNTEKVVIGTVHWNQDSTNSHRYRGSETDNTYGQIDSIESWHTYAIEWTPSGMSWYVDDQCYQTIKFTSDMSELKLNHFIILNLAIGSNNTPFTKYTTITSAFTDATMYVDYVRVYQNLVDSEMTGSWNNVNFYDGTKKVSTQRKWSVEQLSAPSLSKSGYVLDGWYTANGKKFDINNPSGLYGIDLYAKWTKKTTTPAIREVTVKKPVIKKLTSPSKRKVKITMKTKDKAVGFQIKYGTNKKVTKGVKKVKTTKKTYTFKKLKSKKTYYFKIREYKYKANGKIKYSSWTTAKKVKVK